MNETVLSDDDKFFWLKSGKGLRSIREMANYLPSIKPDEWNYHVNEEKNDFSNWIRDVFDEAELAKFLRETKTKIEFQNRLYNHVIHTKIKEKQEARKKEQTQPAKQPVQQAAEPAKEPVPEQDKLIKDPDAFADYHEKDSKRKDELADRFDAVANKMEESVNPEEPKEIEQSVEKLEEQYKELRQQIAEARKQGKDPLIAELTIRPLESKLKYARVTRNLRDFEKIRTILAEGEKELKDALAFEEPNLKKEVEEMVKQATQPAVPPKPKPENTTSTTKEESTT